ncbi:MAG: hypothetical protein U0793_08915 [Gemmataceae bacterium]
MAAPLRANPPVASYVFPAGGQRGKAVDVRVGGLFLQEKCGFEMLGPGLKAPSELRRTRTLWFEGPILPLPDSQRAEDYPKDMAGRIEIALHAPPGLRHWRLWTAQKPRRPEVHGRRFARDHRGGDRRRPDPRSRHAPADDQRPHFPA